MSARRWAFFDAIYQAQFYVYRCPYAAFCADLKRRWGIEQSANEPGGKAIRHETAGGKRLYFLWVSNRNRARSSYHIGIVAHEVMHLALFVLMARGINANIDDHEPYCYYVEWLLAETLKRLRA